MKCFLLEKKVTGKAVLGGGVSQEWSPPLHLQTARDSQPWVLSAASVYSEWGHSLGRGQAAQQAEREAGPTSPVGTRNKD